MTKKIHGADHVDGTPDHEHADLQAQADTSTIDMTSMTETVGLLSDYGTEQDAEAGKTRDLVDAIDVAQKDQQDQITALKKRLDDQGPE